MDTRNTLRELSEVDRAVLYRREELPAPISKRVDAIEQRLGELVGQSVNTQLETNRWCAREPLTDASEYQQAYAEFCHWAAETGCSLQPFFAIRECYTTGKTDRGDWLVFPVLCLAFYNGERVKAVYPHRQESDDLTVEDGLSRLETALATRPDAGQARGADKQAVKV